MNADITHDEDFFKLLIKILIDRGGAGEDVIHAADDIVSCLGKSGL